MTKFLAKQGQSEPQDSDFLAITRNRTQKTIHSADAVPGRNFHPTASEWNTTNNEVPGKQGQSVPQDSDPLTTTRNREATYKRDLSYGR